MKTRKRFGQHFLQEAWVRKVVASLDARPSDTFIEIGPGRGALTRPLAPLVKRLIAIEIDRDLVSLLRREVTAGVSSDSAPENTQGVVSNVEIVEGDILETNLRELVPADAAPARVVGNLPYYISSPILFRLLAAADDGKVLSNATLMLQREVAERLTARPGTGEYGLLTIFVQLHAGVSHLLSLPPGAFRPAPDVDSSVVRLDFREPERRPTSPALFEKMVKAMFEQRRKTIANGLKRFAGNFGVSSHEILARSGVDERRRPETLELSELIAIEEVFASVVPPDVL